MFVHLSLWVWNSILVFSVVVAIVTLQLTRETPKSTQLQEAWEEAEQKLKAPSYAENASNLRQQWRCREKGT